MQAWRKRDVPSLEQLSKWAWIMRDFSIQNMPTQQLNEKDESAAIHIVVHWRNPQNSSIITFLILNWFLWCSPPMMPVTTRIIIFGDPYLLHPSFGIGRLASGQLESEEIIIHEHHPEHIRQYLPVREESLELFPSSLGWTSPFLNIWKGTFAYICHNFFPGWTTAVCFRPSPFWWVYALQRHVIWMLVHVWHNGGCPDGPRRVTLGFAKGGCFEPWWKQNVFAKHLRLGGLLRSG